MSVHSWERLFSATGDPDGPPAGWRTTLADGREFCWEGFYTGPIELGLDDLEAAARQLLGLSLEGVAAAAQTEICPSTHDDGKGPSIVLHSATPVLKSAQGDLADAINGRTPDDVATYVETRAVSLALPGDLVVGRTHTWQVAAKVADIEAVKIPGIDWYYLSHAIIRLIQTDPTSPQIVRLVEALRARPHTVVRVYSLDRELQIVLLYLRRAADIECVYVDANSPEIASYWNTKAPLHPLVTDIASVTASDPLTLLRAETTYAPMQQRLGITYERLPGYTVDAAGETTDEVAERLLAAARFLRQRYGLLTGCLKPSEGGGGARITPGVDLTDEVNLRAQAEILRHTKELYVLEAQVDYATLTIGSRRVRISPSAHVRYGQLAEGITLQLTNGTSWQGNVYIDRPSCADIGLSPDHYDTVLGTVEALRAAFAARRQQLVTGGVDFAVGRVGGAFSDHLFIAVQDPNLSSHGAEYLRRFLDEMHTSGGPQYAATKVICPTAAGTLPTMRQQGHLGLAEASRFRVISAIPGRWGMLAAGANSPAVAVEEVLAFEKDLVGKGLTFEAPPR